ncbi:MAG: hypothetical protein MUO72_14520 [Bacteroidales bacterium]|nr:hypothetical protein [Bacteroidales bacterium]
MTETILETGQFHKGTIDQYRFNDSQSLGNDFQKGVEHIDAKISEFTVDYKKTYPDRHFSHMIFYYVKEHPGVFLAKIFLCPVFFFALSSREIVSYLLLIITSIYLILTWKGIKSILLKEKDKQFFLIILSVLFGYFLLHWMTHAYSRYSLVILPYLYIWTGPQVVNLIMKIKNKFRIKV